MDDKAKIQEAIKMQGEVVRKLKGEKACKEQVSVSGWFWWNPDRFFHVVTRQMSSFSMTGRRTISFTTTRICLYS